MGEELGPQIGPQALSLLRPGNRIPRHIHRLGYSAPNDREQFTVRQHFHRDIAGLYYDGLRRPTRFLLLDRAKHLRVPGCEVNRLIAGL